MIIFTVSFELKSINLFVVSLTRAQNLKPIEAQKCQGSFQLQQRYSRSKLKRFSRVLEQNGWSGIQRVTKFNLPLDDAQFLFFVKIELNSFGAIPFRETEWHLCFKPKQSCLELKIYTQESTLSVQPKIAVRPKVGSIKYYIPVQLLQLLNTQKKSFKK